MSLSMHAAEALTPRVGYKRLILLCDGTWNSAYNKKGVHESTNVVRLTRAILPEDRTASPSVPQVVFYQSGIGTTGTLMDLADGAMGIGLIEKIKECYSFVVNNWLPGDEILIFGFSRGAYTARMIGSLISELGILDPTTMDDFYDIFSAFRKLCFLTSAGKAQAETYLADYRAGGSKAGEPVRDNTLKCIGVWDTVGAVGLPGHARLTMKRKFMGFNATELDKNVKYAFHALSINEQREDFLPTKWIQPPEQRQKGQVLKQVWFMGDHSDVGGGWDERDLSDIALVWMIANIVEHGLLSINEDYILKLPRPEFPWGQMTPHKPKGLMALARKTVRKTPDRLDDETQERFHDSLLVRTDLNDGLKRVISNTPELVAPLLPLELKIKAKWMISRDSTINNCSPSAFGLGLQNLRRGHEV